MRQTDDFDLQIPFLYFELLDVLEILIDHGQIFLHLILELLNIVTDFC